MPDLELADFVAARLRDRPHRKRRRLLRTGRYERAYRAEIGGAHLIVSTYRRLAENAPSVEELEPADERSVQIGQLLSLTSLERILRCMAMAERDRPGFQERWDVLDD
jgi:hypothetical protein